MNSKILIRVIAVLIILVIVVVVIDSVTKKKSNTNLNNVPPPQILEATINKSAIDSYVQIIPRQVYVDSRCPVNVKCVQAGTVQIRATINEGMSSGRLDYMMTLGLPLITHYEKVELVDVKPSIHSGETIATSSYVFVFKTQKLPPKTE